MEIEPFLRAPDVGGAFKGRSDLVAALIGGDDPIDGYGDDGLVAVTETEAEVSDLSRWCPCWRSSVWVY